ncbi:MAG: heme exporter protein CcmD [Dokdonella sp.]|nr:MAG: heme exporter protein CcmD [Dokdonella sp.]
MAEFIAMGGYAFYVWASIGVFVGVLALDALAPLAQRRRVLADIRGRLQRRAAREQREHGGSP